jgi:crotonobetainyl-CoA:carnitine CoA-transferase CaiB-like acyl-CoA transferase
MQERGARSEAAAEAGGFLAGVRVLELADELGEYCGKVLAGLGADVIKVEPPGGETTRSFGPFVGDEPNRDRSLYFWHYNLGKRGIVLDLDDTQGQESFRHLAQDADVIIETRSRGYLDDRGIGYEALSELAPSLIVARISPFGDVGPWGDFKGSDLVHLALGGIMMNCGYDPDPEGFYETPPIAPQMWQAYHIAGEMMVLGILGALHYRQRTGRGQHLTSNVHEAVAQNTEQDVAKWIYGRATSYRRTARHSSAQETPPFLMMTKDGRWMAAYRTYLTMESKGGAGAFERLLELLDRYGLADDLTEPRYDDHEFVTRPSVDKHVVDVVSRFVSRFMFSREIWRDGQEAGQTWGPVRKPEESLEDPHWNSRGAFAQIEHPELDASYQYIGARWVCPQVAWRVGPRAPLLGEHTQEVLAAPGKASSPATQQRSSVSIGVGGTNPAGADGAVSKRGKPFALAGVTVIDLGWVVASAAPGRFLAALGAEVIKIEHRNRLDFVRWSGNPAPLGGRAERESATAPLTVARPESPDRDGFFMELNAGKRAVSLNIRNDRGKEILERLIRRGDAVISGFSPGTMERMGFGYERVSAINPAIVYAAQSGMGQRGTYPPMRTFGPTAAAMSGLTEMSGLPEPFPPAGIGYSYLDWFGAYNLAMAVLAGVYRQRATGLGCCIDASQSEAGFYLSGTAVLDHSVNGRVWHRYGNRSPYRPAAPHGAYRAQGADRWIAIACFEDAEWDALLTTLDERAWRDDARFETLEQRIAHRDELDELVNAATMRWDAGELMLRLQEAGVPAGVCQTAEDRIDHDPQLKHLGWMVELSQKEIGSWPVRELPVRMSETPAYIGGIVDRSGPCYGEDNDHVYRELLGLSQSEIQELEREGTI